MTDQENKRTPKTCLEQKGSDWTWGTNPAPLPSAQCPRVAHREVPVARRAAVEVPEPILSHGRGREKTGHITDVLLSMRGAHGALRVPSSAACFLHRKLFEKRERP